MTETIGISPGRFDVALFALVAAPSVSTVRAARMPLLRPDGRNEE